MISLSELPFVASLLAGIATFVSPCLLPLIPGYISFITGTSDQLKGGTDYRHTFLSAILFVLGFTFVFTLLGASATYLGNLLGEHKTLLRWIGGIMVIILGLHTAGIIRINLLYQERRLQIKSFALGYLGTFLVGAAFALGWTPCVGPLLSSILILASTQETVYKGMALLGTYSFGLGIPFLITALFVNRCLRLFARIKRFYKIIEVTSGIILILVGILLITNSLQALTPL